MNRDAQKHPEFLPEKNVNRRLSANPRDYDERYSRDVPESDNLISSSLDGLYSDKKKYVKLSVRKSVNSYVQAWQ
jgi:hypothetical protein